MDSSPQSSRDPTESAREPLLVPEFHVGHPVSNTKTTPHIKDGSLSLPSLHREYRKDNPTSAGETKEVTHSAVTPKPAPRMKYRLEMPQLSIPSRNTKTGSDDIMPSPPISVLPKVPTLGNINVSSDKTKTPSSEFRIPSLGNHSVSFDKTKTSSTQLHIPSSVMLNSTPRPSIWLQQEKLASLQVSSTRPSISTSTILPRHPQQEKLAPFQIGSTRSSTSTSTILPRATSEISKELLLNLTLKPNSQSSEQQEFRFKVPRGPVSEPGPQVGDAGAGASQPLHVAQPVNQASSQSCLVSNNSSSHKDSHASIRTNSEELSMDWHSGVPVTPSCPGGVSGNLCSDPVYHEMVSMPQCASKVAQPQLTCGPGNDNVQFLDDSYSCGPAEGHDLTTGLADGLGVNQPSLLQTQTQEQSGFTNQPSEVSIAALSQIIMALFITI